MTDKSSTVTRAMPPGKISLVHVTNISLDSWIVTYNIPAYVLADIGGQLTSKLFAALCVLVGVKHLMAAVYHAQFNGRLNGTVIK